MTVKKRRTRLSHKFVASIFSVAFVLTFLLAVGDPGISDVTILDTSARGLTGSAQSVKTRLELINRDYIFKFPETINGWRAAETYGTSEIQKNLGAEALLLRAYLNDTAYQPIFLSILRSQDITSFHKPEICWGGAGYKFEDEDQVSITVDDTNWASGEWRSNMEGAQFRGQVTANRLIITKQNEDGEIAEKRATLYFYIKGGLLNDKVVMVVVQSVAPVALSPAQTEKSLEQFTSDVIPSLFMPPERANSLVAWKLMQQYSAFLGWLIVVAAVAIPIVVIYFTPAVGRKQ